MENNSTIPYSATKMRAKGPLPNSTLNPDTNSDSPSAKSKGARLHSAKHVNNQTTNPGKIINKETVLYSVSESILNLVVILTRDKIIKASLIS